MKRIKALFASAFCEGIIRHKGFRPGRKDAIDPEQLKTALEASLRKRDADMQTLIDKIEKSTGEAATALKEQLAAHVAKSAELQTQLEGLTQEFAALKSARSKQTEDAKSIGEQFCETDDFKNLAQRGKGTAVMRLKAVTSVTSTTVGTGAAGDLIVADRLPGILTPAQRRLTVRDLLAPGRTNSNSIEYVKESGFQNNAAVVAEGGLKPQSDISFTKLTSPVRTIAHWLKASVQILADVPQLESYINTRMVYGLKYAEETELLAGDGTGEHLLGLIPQATAFDDTLRVAGDTKIDTLRRAIFQCRRALYPASGIVLNPKDWMEIELTKDANDRYLWVNVTTGGISQLWRLPVVESDAITAGNFLVGSFNMACQIFDREDANVQVSTEDGDNFVKNMVTIRVEERLGMVVYRPEAMVYGPFVQAT